jgi:HK97 family phage major capsid protein
MDHERNVDKLKEHLDAIMGIQPKEQAPSDTARAEAYRTAFWDNMYTGMPNNTIKEGHVAGGTYLVPDSFEKRLVEGLAEENVLRKIGNVFSAPGRLRLPVADTALEGKWVGENGCFEFNDLTFSELVFTPHKLGTSILVSEELLEDSGIDLENHISRLFSERIGKAEEEAFIRGDGNGKPRGLIYQTSVGTETASADTVTPDDMIDLMYSVKPAYRANGTWLVSEQAYLQLRKARTLDGRQLWPTSLAEGEVMKLLGHPILVSKYLDGVLPGAKTVLFGDFSYFWIAEHGKRNIKRLAERYADLGQVGFFASQRVDAQLVLPEAVKALEVKAA